MKQFKFPYFFSLGRGDSSESTIDYELSDEQAKRLVKSAKEGGRFRLDEDEDIEDIYSLLYEAVIEREKALLWDDPSPVKDYLSWKPDFDPGEAVTEEQINEYIDRFNIGVLFPEALQMLDAPKKRVVKQSKVDSVVLNREDADDYIEKHSGKDERIILTDNGGTLYYVPKKYSGIFTVDSSIKKISANAFLKRKKITEIVIENGIKELPEWAFDSCEASEKVTIPASIAIIPFNTFTKCRRLKTVIIEEGVKEIHSRIWWIA